MLILFDVGNTNIVFAVSDGIEIKNSYRINTFENKTLDEYYLIIKNFITCTEVKKAIISSVVPEITKKLEEMIIKHFKITPIIVSQGIKTGLKIKAINPKEVGSDLICDAIGSFSYGNDVLIIDLGTANKYIYVKDKTLIGVVIAPGVKISINSLVSNTALLPKIELKVPDKILGNNSIMCMQSGVTYGVACEVDGLIKRIKEEVKSDFKIIATGGLANLIIPLCKEKILIDENLIFKGLLTIYKKNEEDSYA